MDFIIGGKNGEIIQVSYEMPLLSTRSLETSAIVEAAKDLGAKSGKIITYDYEREELIDGILIHYIPFWVWALYDTKQQ